MYQLQQCQNVTIVDYSEPTIKFMQHKCKCQMKTKDRVLNRKGKVEVPAISKLVMRMQMDLSWDGSTEKALSLVATHYTFLYKKEGKAEFQYQHQYQCGGDTRRRHTTKDDFHAHTGTSGTKWSLNRPALSHWICWKVPSMSLNQTGKLTGNGTRH